MEVDPQSWSIFLVDCDQKNFGLQHGKFCVQSTNLLCAIIFNAKVIWPLIKFNSKNIIEDIIYIQYFSF